MGFGPAEEFLAWLKQMQAEGKVISAGELVRRMKAGPGPESLGSAGRVVSMQEAEQQGIEAETLTVASRLESAWAGASGDAARGSLRPLADLATSASAALRNSQNILTDQAHAFALTRDSLHEVSDDPSPKTAWDMVTLWDTDHEDKINQRNAAIQQNNAIYQGFTSTSDGHARGMPTDYGQVPSAADGTYTVQPATASGRVTGKQNHGRPTVGRGHSSDFRQPANQPGSTVEPESTVEPGIDVAPPEQYSDEQHPGEQQSVHIPAARHGEDGTRTTGYTPPGTELQGPRESAPVGYNVPSGGPVAGTGGYYSPGTYLPVESDGGTGLRRGSPAAPGKATGTGRFGGAAEPRGATGPGAAGVRGANGMPLTAGTGKGDKKEEDEEHQTPDYLQEADPGALFGYDGKATPPVIGK